MVARKPVDLDDLHRRHASGQSVLQMSREVGLSRPSLIRRLQDLGLEIRGRSEANHLRLARLSPVDRRALTRAANESVRKPPGTSRDWHARNYGTAQTRERTLSVIQPDERLFLDLAKSARVRISRQVAIGPYNLDFRIGPVAVEIHSAAHHPLRLPRLAERTVNLLSAGWHVGYLWGWGLAGAHDLLAWAQETSRDIPLGGQYRVVRGNGEIVTFSREELDQRSRMKPPSRAVQQLPKPSDLS